MRPKHAGGIAEFWIDDHEDGGLSKAGATPEARPANGGQPPIQAVSARLRQETEITTERYIAMRNRETSWFTVLDHGVTPSSYRHSTHRCSTAVLKKHDSGLRYVPRCVGGGEMSGWHCICSRLRVVHGLLDQSPRRSRRRRQFNRRRFLL